MNTTDDSSLRTANTKTHPANTTTIVFENGTIIGAITESTTQPPSTQLSRNSLMVPEIVISGSHNSSTSLNHFQNRCSDGVDNVSTVANNEETAIESTALLGGVNSSDLEASLQQEEFEQFLLNRTISESNMLDSSIYSELQFTSAVSEVGSGGSTATQQAALQPTATDSGTHMSQDPLNTSNCSRDSRPGKRTRRKHKSKSKCSVSTTSRATPVLSATGYPPQYTAIFLDPLHPHHATATVAGSEAANAMGQIANAATAAPFLSANSVSDATTFLQQQYQYFQQRPLLSSLGHHHHHHHRGLIDSAVPLTATDASTAPSAGGSAITTPTSTLTPPFRLSFRKWFSRPSLPFVIGILALGGVACTLGGIVLGSTGLIEHSTQYLSAALLMIGIGVSLLVISGAIWRLSLPDDADECPCYRHMEACRNCNSPFCNNNRLLPGGYFYPEFQHRPPPPPYLTSLNECTATMGFLLHPAAQAQQAAFNTIRMNTPPPLYRSTNSLNVLMPGNNTNVGTPSVHPTVTTCNATSTQFNHSGHTLPDQRTLTMNAVIENLSLQAQSQMQTPPILKEINYLELD